MRIIITGGSGLIGRALTADLALDNHEVIILSRRPERVIDLPNSAIAEWWDGYSSKGWGPLVDNADAVVNLAGENLGSGRWTRKRKHDILESRLNAGRAVAKAVEAARHKPQVVIQASAVGYYGSCGDEEVTEDAAPGCGFLARTAIEWENSTTPVEAMGVRRVIIRTGVVLSIAGGALARMLLPYRLFAIRRLANGKQWLPWIHITDEVNAIRFLMENEKARGVFNLTDPNPATNAEFSFQLEKRLRRPALVPIPKSGLSLFLGEMATALIDGQRAIPKRLLQLGFTFRFTGINLALKDLLG
ncbi:MAG TPA: TIGR01777 family protein [Dehalococcoidia bacterium]|nr:TIGR01777 family protein [Dehalococcoidia bacterium]